MKYVLQCDHVYDEAARIANAICGLVHGGARYRDIVVVICDYDDTVSIYNEIFLQSGIPVNVDVGMKLIEHPFTKYLRDVLARSPWLKTCPPLKGSTVKQICAGLLKLAENCEDQTAKTEITKLLSTCTEILGAQEISIQEFSNMFCTLCAAAKISDVPAYADRVLLCAAKEYEPCFVPYLFIAGANDSTFPVQTGDTDIITEQDIGHMAIRIEPSASLQNRRAKTHATNILKSAAKQLYLSYSTTNISGERVGKCAFIGNTWKPVPEDGLHCKSYAKLRLLQTLGSGQIHRDGQGEYWASVQQAVDIKGMRVPQLNKTPENICCAGALFFPNNRASVTQIENFVKCPYYHFLVNGLGAKARDTNQIGPNVIGTILHEIAEKLGKGSTLAVALGVLKKYDLPPYSVSAIKTRAKQMEKFLRDDIAQSKYKPHLFEHPLQGQIEGITVRGIADRIDTQTINGKTHAVVWDYKSGDVKKPKLQIPLYMDFLRGEYAVDDGYYLSFKDFVKKGTKPTEAEEAIIQARVAITAMKSGCITPEPLGKGICEYCPAGAMCGRRA